jgi:hypothetical protein
MAGATKNHLLHFPGGRVKDGTMQVNVSKSHFGMAIDDQDHVWVSNALSDTVVRFSADGPSKAESVRVGIGAACALSRRQCGVEQHVARFSPTGHPRRRVDDQAV